MADNSVFITGAAEGVFTDALKELPGWATEETAESIEKILRKNLNIQTQALRDLVRVAKDRDSSGNGIDNSITKNANSELGKLVKLFKLTAEEEKKERRRKKQRDKEEESSTSGVRKFTGTADKARFVLENLAKMGGHVLDANKQYITTANNLYKSGINILDGEDKQTSSLLALNDIVKRTGVRLEIWDKAVEKHGSSMNAVGIIKFSKAVEMSKHQMAALGLSVEDGVNALGTFVENQTRYNDMRGKDAKTLSTESVNFAKNIIRASKSLGLSVEQVLNNTKELAKSTNMSIVSAQSGKKVADKLTEALSAAPPELSKMITSMVAAAGAGQLEASDEFRIIAGSASSFTTTFQKLIYDLEKGSLSQTEFNDRIQRMVRDPRWEQDMRAMQQYRRNPEAAAMLDLMALLQNMANSTSKVTEQQLANAQQSQKTVADFLNAEERKQASMQALFVPLESQIKSLTRAMEVLNDAVYGLAENTSVESRAHIGALAIMTKFITDNVIPVLGSIAAFKYIFAGGAAAGAGAAGAGAAGAGAASGSMLSRLFPWLMKGGTVGGGLLLHSGGLNTNEAEELAKRRAMGPTITGSQISVPTDPIQPTINSPSAVSTNPAPNPDTPGSSAASPIGSPGAGIEKSSNTIDINTSLAFQNTLLQQILLTSERLVSINTDILRYTRIN